MNFTSSGWSVLPGEHVQIGDDRHLVINGQRLDASTPHFENVYGFDPNKPPEKASIPATSTARSRRNSICIPISRRCFPTRRQFSPTAADSYMVMGDNTCNSSDSRTWGISPRKTSSANLSSSIGRSRNASAGAFHHRTMSAARTRNGLDHRRVVGHRPGAGEMFCRRRLTTDPGRAQHVRFGNARGRIATGCKIEAIVLTADLSLPETPGKIYSELKGRGIVVDVLVNNAGFGSHDLFWNCRCNGNLK